MDKNTLLNEFKTAPIDVQNETIAQLKELLSVLEQDVTYLGQSGGNNGREIVEKLTQIDALRVQIKELEQIMKSQSEKQVQPARC